MHGLRTLTLGIIDLLCRNNCSDSDSGRAGRYTSEEAEDAEDVAMHLGQSPMLLILVTTLHKV